MSEGRLGSAVRAALPYMGVTIVTLVVLDLVLIATGLFPPVGRYGHADVGWVASPPSDSVLSYQCYDQPTRSSVTIQRNERGYRTDLSEVELARPNDWFELAVTGDSHTDQCMTNEEMHFGVMAGELTAAGVENAVFSFGAGRYSPLQEYLAVVQGVRDFESDALVINLYTGNDFYDILRVDDRPHLVESVDGYEIAPPVWYTFDDPTKVKRSRIAHAVGQVSDQVGVGTTWTRLRYLRAAARDQGGGVGSVVGYLSDIRRATQSDAGYAAAFAAQILNQQLFFWHFPGTRQESVDRIAYLLSMIREEHPGILLVMSPIPSYQLAGEQPVDQMFLDVLESLPFTYEEGAQLEGELYAELRGVAESNGWLFVDNLETLRGYDRSERLYNDFDYHVTRTAMELIGRTQAESILEYLEGRGER